MLKYILLIIFILVSVSFVYPQANGADTNVINRRIKIDEVIVSANKVDPYVLLDEYIENTMHHVLKTDTQLVYKFHYATIHNLTNDTLESASGKILLNANNGISTSALNISHSRFLTFDYSENRHLDQTSSPVYATIGELFFGFNIVDTRFYKSIIRREISNKRDASLIVNSGESPNSKIFNYYEAGDTLKIQLYFDSTKKIDSVYWHRPCSLVKHNIYNKNGGSLRNKISVKMVYDFNGFIFPSRIEEQYYAGIDSTTTTFSFVNLEIANSNVEDTVNEYTSDKTNNIQKYFNDLNRFRTYKK